MNEIYECWMANVGWKHTNVENSPNISSNIIENVERNVGLVCSCLNDFCTCKMYLNTLNIINLAVSFSYVPYSLLIKKCSSVNVAILSLRIIHAHALRTKGSKFQKCFVFV